MKGWQAAVLISGIAFVIFVIPQAGQGDEGAAKRGGKGSVPAPVTAPFPKAPWLDESGSSGRYNFSNPNTLSPFPRNDPWTTRYPSLGRQASPSDTRIRTVWEGPSREDEKKLDQIQKHQLQFGPDDPRTAKLMWATAEHLCKIQKFYEAEKLLKELVASLENSPHKSNIDLRDRASAKLAEVQGAIKRSREHTPPIHSRYSRWR